MFEVKTGGLIGKSVRRTEDLRFITGRGQYTDDVVRHHMAHAVFGGFEHAVGARLRGVVVIVREARARPGGEVDEHIITARPDALHHLVVKGKIHARLGGLRIAHVDVHDGRTRLGGIDRRPGDLFRRHRHRRVAAGRVGRAGHRA